MTTATRLFDTTLYPSLTQEGGKSNEWYTPSRYIEAAREVMGGIDLDPASCESANRTVKASRYYTKEEDGLSKEWYGRVWLNPPYGMEYGKAGTGPFLRKCIEGYEANNVGQAIILTMIGMYTDWFFLLLDYPLCYPRVRPRFLRPNGSTEHHRYTSCIAYLGPHEQKFIEVFSQFGRIVKAVDTPRQPVVPLSLWEEV